MELKQFSDVQLLKELKNRGYITGLLLSTKDVDIVIDELEGDLIDEIKDVITFEKKLEFISSINVDDIGDKILDDIKDMVLEEFGNSK